jgi:anaerobic selenocysteine-containing dehydrogenase
MKIIRTYCKICNSRCGILAYIENGKIKKIKGDPNCEKNCGALCIKGKSMLEFLYDTDRLAYPAKKHHDRWVRLSWDDALDEIAERLSFLKNEFGPECVALYRGMPVNSLILDIYLKRFANIFGTPNITSNAALCISSKVVATRFTFGKGISICGDFRNSKCILLFGTNPVVSGMHRTLRIAKDIRNARKQGAKLIVVDPKKTEIASKADLYTTIRPGTDGALVLSLIHVIIENRWYDPAFTSRHTVGFERLREMVSPYTPETVEKITWIHPDTIRKIAEIFATTRPACAERREGVIHHENGTQTCRAINVLNAITGNIDVSGSIQLSTNLFDPSDPLAEALTLRSEFSPSAKSISNANPITTNVPLDLIRAILEEKPYPVKALIIIGSNPLLSWPNARVILNVLRKVKFLVAIDVYGNETVQFADFILPAATFLEKTDIQVPNVAIPKILQMQEKVVEPLHESRSEFRIIQELADKLGFGAYFQDNEEELTDKVLSPWGISVDTLRQNNSGIPFDPNPVGFFRKNGFPTPSGKVELYSETLKNAGFNPLPAYEEPTESPVSNPDLAKAFPLILVSGNRLNTSYLSFLHNLPSLHARCPENWVEIHPDTAAKRGIREGDRVFVESLRGKIQLSARLNTAVDPRVVCIPSGWGHHYNASWRLANSTPGENVNLLTDHLLCDKITGMPDWKSLLVEVGR